MQPLDERARRKRLCVSALLCAAAASLAPAAARSSFSAITGGAVAGHFALPTPEPARRAAPIVVPRDPFISPPPVNTVGAGALTLRAIVTGEPPRALIEEAGQARIVAPGDEVAGSRVRSIGNGTLQLEDGTQLVLAPEQP
jgi:hypothetical protein